MSRGRVVGLSEKISGLLGRDAAGYGTGSRRQGGRTDANPFRYLQYTERKEQTKRRVVISVEGDGSVKCGCGVLPRYQIDGGNIHTEIGWV